MVHHDIQFAINYKNIQIHGRDTKKMVIVHNK